MGNTVSWLALVLAGFAAAPAQKTERPDIKYQFTSVEARGLEWRQLAGGKIKPVARRGVASVWTAPKSFFKGLPEGTVGPVTHPTTVTASPLATAHLTNRKGHSIVTQASWSGDESAPRSATETIREGWAATVSGRRLDQGTLIQLVIENTEITTLHSITLASSTASDKGCDRPCCKAGSPTLRSAATPPTDCAVKVTAAAPPADCVVKVTAGGTGCDTACPAAGHARSCDSAATQVSLSSRSAFVCAAGVAADTAKATTRDDPESPSAFQVPEVSRAEVAGEWLVPNGEYLVIGFGPHTVAGPDGKAVVKERLVLLTAQESGPARPRTSSNDAPSSTSDAPRDFIVPRIPQDVAASPMATPGLPSRSIPQGIHADGTPAELPPLPDDEKVETTKSNSAQPMPSPQTKKPVGVTLPVPKADTPTTPPPTSTKADERAKKASFRPEANLFRPTGLFPLPLPGIQFLVPIKPLALRLPFNQMLEIEILGRIVTDPEVDSDTEVAISPLLQLFRR